MTSEPLTISINCKVCGWEQLSSMRLYGDEPVCASCLVWVVENQPVEAEAEHD